MLVPTLGTDIDLYQLEVQWQALTGVATGGSAITSYNLQYDQGTGSWLDVIGDDLDPSLDLSTVIEFLQPATLYKFRIRAKNIYGRGPFSSEVTFQTSDVPLGTTSITMTIQNLNVKVAWDLPFANYLPIDAYRIYVRDTTGNSYNLEDTNCDGSKP